VSSSPLYLDAVVVPLIRGKTVLDAGCGLGRWGALIETNYWEAGLETPPAVDGFDAFEANIERCRSRGFYREVWQHELPAPLPAGSWDTVLAVELIEHLRPEDVESALDVLEAAATCRVICTTPSFPDIRPGRDSPVGYNEWEAHLGYVPADTFRERGYHLRGAGFGRPTSAFVRIATRLRLGTVLSGLPRAIPTLGHSIVAVKDVG
jgi:SAM-dependent methyltransferase